MHHPISPKGFILVNVRASLLHDFISFSKVNLQDDSLEFLEKCLDWMSAELPGSDESFVCEIDTMYRCKLQEGEILSFLSSFLFFLFL